jgi:hypothetical protein
MTTLRSFLTLALALALGEAFACCGISAADRLDSLLSRLSAGPVEQRDLLSLEEQPADSRTVPMLKEIFAKKTDKKDRQLIAATLLRLGENAAEYYEFLAGYAKTAIKDQTPFFLKYDRSGTAIRGEFSTEFQNWCATSGEDPKVIAGLQFVTYPEDLLILARVQDPRSRDLFRQGLESRNPLIVAYSVQGLARLNDVDAIPLIARAADRQKPGDKFAIAMNLPWYAGGEASQLLQQLVPDTSHRIRLAQQVQRVRLAERERTLHRQGQSPLQ